MINKNGKIVGAVLLALALIALSIVSVSGAYVYSNSFSGLGSGYSSSSYQYQPSFQTYYGSSASTYWPILTDSETCLARQDIILQVSPTGCQPMTVRSDLIADQNVPVFCQIDALQLNPLLNVKEIRNIQFTGSYPKEVANVGFHPARAALNTRDRLLGSPLLNNIGYVVVVLKRTPNESALPNFVSLNLSGTIEYDAGNAFGVGINEFNIQPTDDQEWQTEGVKNSFWDGRYFVRVESADTDYAVISLYDGIKKIASRKVKMGQTTEPMFMPGYYCQFGLQISYDSLVKAEDKARIEINDGSSTNVLDVYKGTNIINGKCNVQDVYVNPSTGSTGSVRINCGDTSILLQKNAVMNIQGLSSGQISHSYTNDNKEECRVDFADGSAYYIDRQYDKKRNEPTPSSTWSALQFGGKVSSSSKTTVTLTEADKASIRDKLLQACVIGDEPLNGDANDDAEIAFNDAVNYYEKVADQYPNEAQSSGVGSNKYGKLALEAALEIVNQVKGKGYNKAQTEVRIMSKIVSIYPEFSSLYNSKINNIYSFDSGLSVASVNVDNKYRTITLVSLSKPNQGDRAEAIFMYGNSEIRLKKGEVKSLPGKGNAKVNLTDFDASTATITTNCIELQSDLERSRRGGSNYELTSQSNNNVLTSPRTFRIASSGTNSDLVCGTPMVLRDTVLQKVAKVRISPVVQGTQGKTNVSVKIGIEKRAIQLGPDRAKKIISDMNASIKKWETISKNLVKLEKGLKGACLTTATVLTVKNFFSGIDGTSAARQDVMSGKNGWNSRCADAVKTSMIDLNGDGKMVATKKQYTSVSQCLSDYGNEIEADVTKRKNVLTEVNSVIKGIQKDKTITQNEVVNQDKAIKALYDQIPEDCKRDFKLQKPVIRTDVPNNQQYAPYSYSELVDIYKNCMILKQSPSNIGANDSLTSAATLAKNNFDEFNKLTASSAAGGFLQSAPKSPGSAGSTDVQGTFYTLKFEGDRLLLNGQTVNADDTIKSEIRSYLTNNVASAFLMRDAIVKKGAKNSPDNISAAIVIGDTGANAKLQQKAVYAYSENPSKGGPGITISKMDNLGANMQGTLTNFRTLNRVDNIQQFGQGLYGNSIRQQDRKVLYFISGPDKDLPSQVPFDINNGWYAKVESRSLNMASNAISSYDSSGLPKRWQICNVGDDHMINQNDRCQEVVQGVSTSATILGLDEKSSKDLVLRSQRALLDAASQKGSASKSITISGQRMEVGAQDPMSNVQCQNFMSSAECKIMFNVCDPVICSPSRCDMGGQYRVSNVQQTGIIGSIALCLPNINEGIAIPVCVSGIRNGIDNYISLMKQYRDCMQQNIDTGQLVGVCDEIQSVYLCEFFWRQISPIAQMLLPKLITGMFSKGEGQVRGGGEYLLAQKALENTQSTMNYFTQYYGENMMKSFQIRSVEEAGTDICKGFVSTTIPTKIKTLIEPDSPPQFTARFDEIPYSSVTVPATSQYKVFYFINAGKDSGVYYSVYLKNPPESGFYYSTQTIMVASGYLGKGQSASETLDRTLPEGYKQICVRVNNQEECGFKQTSTSFAVNSLRDAYVKEELTNTNVKTEAGCVSGTSSLTSVAGNLNIQSAAAESLMPQISQRGIVRICATNNPGGTTDPTRYVDAGYCGDPKMRCWLDKNSVNNAITDANIGAKNQTLSQLESKQFSDLFSQTGFLDNNTAVQKINELQAAAGDLKSNITLGRANSVDIISQANALYLKAVDLSNSLILNNHKAWLSYVAAQIKQVRIDFYLKSKTSRGSDYISQKIPSKASGSCDNYPEIINADIRVFVPNDNLLLYSSFPGRTVTILGKQYVYSPKDQKFYLYYRSTNNLEEIGPGTKSYNSLSDSDKNWMNCLIKTLSAYTGTTVTQVLGANANVIKVVSDKSLNRVNWDNTYVNYKNNNIGAVLSVSGGKTGYVECIASGANGEFTGLYMLEYQNGNSLEGILYYYDTIKGGSWSSVESELKTDAWKARLKQELISICQYDVYTLGKTSSDISKIYKNGIEMGIYMDNSNGYIYLPSGSSRTRIGNLNQNNGIISTNENNYPELNGATVKGYNIFVQE